MSQRSLRAVALSALICFGANAYGYDEFIEAACDRTFHVPTYVLDANRRSDLDFSVIDEMCCCKDDILSLFKDRTETENKHTNPATDRMLQIIAELEKRIRLNVKEIGNMKQMNALYSFPTIAYTKISETYSDDPTKDEEKSGCFEIDLSNPEDLERYLETVDAMENGGSGSYDVENASTGAFGRYQIMPQYAEEWCKETPPELNCCAVWKESPVCQDEMFKILTQQNIDTMRSLGVDSMPITNCSLYVAHQQGAGGAAWIYGGSLPSIFYNDDGTVNMEKLRSHIAGNLSGEYREKALRANTPDELRELYIAYWSERFGGDILSGSSVSIEDFMEIYDTTEEVLEQRKALWREGILLEWLKYNGSLTDIERKE